MSHARTRFGALASVLALALLIAAPTTSAAPAAAPVIERGWLDHRVVTYHSTLRSTEWRRAIAQARVAVQRELGVTLVETTSPRDAQITLSRRLEADTEFTPGTKCVGQFIREGDDPRRRYMFVLPAADAETVAGHQFRIALCRFNPFAAGAEGRRDLTKSLFSVITGLLRVVGGCGAMSEVAVGPDPRLTSWSRPACSKWDMATTAQRRQARKWFLVDAKALRISAPTMRTEYEYPVDAAVLFLKIKPANSSQAPYDITTHAAPGACPVSAATAQWSWTHRPMFDRWFFDDAFSDTAGAYSEAVRSFPVANPADWCVTSYTRRGPRDTPGASVSRRVSDMIAEDLANNPA